MKVQCRECRVVYDIPVKVSQILAWREGELIQHAMPQLTPGERELILTKICGECFDKLFADDGELDQTGEEAAF